MVSAPDARHVARAPAGSLGWPRSTTMVVSALPGHMAQSSSDCGHCLLQEDKLGAREVSHQEGTRLSGALDSMLAIAAGLNGDPVFGRLAALDALAQGSGFEEALTIGFEVATGPSAVEPLVSTAGPPGVVEAAEHT